MSFTPSKTKSGRSADDSSGVVSYRLARQRMVDGYTRGQRTTEEVCDAQPELRRVAHAFGASLPEPCPICDGDELVTVSFAFGPGLPHAGRVLADLSEVRKLHSRGKPSTCYLIEVCRQCWWNHLRESYGVSG
ncbi:MAG: DUF5318 family protein [Acidimicrobiales bacterium]